MRARRAPEHAGPDLSVPIGVLVLAVDGADAGRLHRSILDRTVEIAIRLGCRGASGLTTLPGAYQGAELAGIRRELIEIGAFADAAHRIGWQLGRLTAAPGELPVPVLETPQGRLWVDAVRGFERYGADGRPAQHEGPARRVPLRTLLAPLTSAAARATLLEVYPLKD